MNGNGKNFSVFFVYQVLLLLVLCQTATGEKDLGLYSATDDVVVLDGGNFPTTVVGSTSAWIVEFYNSWCGHCIKFAPKWKEFAKYLQAWQPVIGIAAVDCANQDNTQLCRKYEANAFPTFKLFRPHTKDTDPGEVYQDQNTDSLLKKIVDFVSNTSSFEPPKSWPKLSPIILMHDIWDETRDDHKHVAFVFEEADSYVGRQVILDTFQYKALLVRRMLRDSVRKFGITTFPSLYLINRDGTFTRVSKKNSTREAMVASLKDLLTPEQLGIKKPAGNHGNKIEMEIADEKEQEPLADSQDTKPGVYMQDLESTLHYSFRQEIAIHRNIEGEKLSALKHFVSLLAKYFPGREAVKSFLEKVVVWLKDVDTELTGDQWLNSIDEMQTVSVYLPDRIVWVGCEGSQLRYRGYPCGMWTLFHTLTVGAYQNGRENPRDLPLDVLSTIQSYMQHFFGCSTCVSHFLKMASSITSADHNPRSAILWLWRAHNKANARLDGDQSEDPKYPKIQFPSKSLCSDCYRGDMFNEDKVFEFLLQFYGKSGIIKPTEDSGEREFDANNNNSEMTKNKPLDWWELQQRKKDLETIHNLRLQKVEKHKKRKERAKNALTVRDKQLVWNEREELNLEAKIGSRQIYGWGFSNFDMGMCVVFYVLCTVIILILYYHFIVRRKYKPWQIFR